MPSLTIIWNGVFSRKRHYRPFAAQRIIRHFHLKRFWRYRPRITFAIVRYVVLASFLGLGFILRRTGWHAESRNDRRRHGHLTVDFKTRDGLHFSTHHIYACDQAYQAVRDI